MESRALVTINVGDILCPNARNSFQAAAARWNADYVELNASHAANLSTPHFLKFEMFRLCPADRIFYIDGGDAIIRSDAPSPFDLCPPTHLGAVRNDQDPVPGIEDIRDQQEIEWALYNHCLGTQYPCAAYVNSGVLVLARQPHAEMLDHARELAEQLSGPRQLLRWNDQTLLNYAAADLGLPILLMDETWNFMHSRDFGHWNGMERFVYHFAGASARHSILPSLNWQAGNPAGRAPAPRSRAVWKPDAKIRPAAAPAERQYLHRLAVMLTQDAICRAADQPVTRLDQLRLLPVRPGPVTQSQLMTPEFFFWCRPLKETPRWHRVLWKSVVLCQVLWERGMLRTGRSGCGLGVGQEALPTLFASFGCQVLATDPSTFAAANPLMALNWRHILSPAEFQARVAFRCVNMASLPQDLGAFDFLWSSDTLERLGSLAQGIEFAGTLCRHLRPGGVAALTTEFNVSSNEETLDRGPLVLFRRRDIEAMQRRVSDEGCRMVEPNYDTGNEPMDLYADRPPYGTPHLKLQVGQFVTTSFLMIVEKPLTNPPLLI